MKILSLLITLVLGFSQDLLSQDDDASSESINRFTNNIAGGYFQYGMMLIEQNSDRDKFKEIIATDMAAIAFNYYFLHVVEKAIEKNIVIEFQVRKALKLNEVKDAFKDPLAWNANPPNLQRGNISDLEYQWYRDRNHDAYQDHVQDFLSYFSTD